uniref:Helicase ATP-binding domain-containing protein n=1 Tax=Anser brachyrhynchus TaxID=132585 RepID=A0A8B9IAH7_9AVES
DESHSVDKDNGEPVVYYLVKWCSLPYEDSTWELKEDVDEGKIGEFKRIQARHPELKRLPRPQAGSWKKLELSHEYKNHNQLREYQLEGVNWLLFNWYNRRNCILADEMGLGKTIQSIAFLQEVYNVGIRGPFLVIAPLSTITNWEREFNTWTEMNSIVYHGSLASRQMIQQYEMYCKDSRVRRKTNSNFLGRIGDPSSPGSWGRWREILSHGRFKRRLSERDVETICRAILVYCLLHYRGDENIKGFIWDLISPSENGKAKELQNHSGLSIPVPRGRKGKKVKSQSTFDVHKAEWIRKYNPDTLFQDESYKKHLKHHPILGVPRPRFGVLWLPEPPPLLPCSEIDIWFPLVEQLEVPTAWWDTEADKSLLIGVFKHGYEKYNTMRADPALCFLEKAGRPDEKAIGETPGVSPKPRRCPQ